ncbi:MAG: hypothetical protein F6K55_14455 [Moorea sp. SIO4A3]|nr:hypothetical protein [Moorena sp. SIO4A3]
MITRHDIGNCCSSLREIAASLNVRDCEIDLLGPDLKDYSSWLREIAEYLEEHTLEEEDVIPEYREMYLVCKGLYEYMQELIRQIANATEKNKETDSALRAQLCSICGGLSSVKKEI